jgi:predicted DNA-binding protein (MmcQ/YjbR family)
MLHNIDNLRAHCLSLPHTSEDFPFDEFTLVFRVGGKIFGLVGIDARPLSINLKCDPERALELRARYPAIQPGYHMILDGTLPHDLTADLIAHSHALVLKGMTRKEREELGL